MKRITIIALGFIVTHVLIRMMDNGPAVGIRGMLVWGWTWDGWEIELMRLVGTVCFCIVWFSIYAFTRAK